jgi:hypothetical protein
MSAGRLPLQIRNEAELKYVPLRSPIECRKVLNTVKGQNERPADALDTVQHLCPNRLGQTRTAATSALTFLTFS